MGMTTALEDSVSIETQARALCQFIVEGPGFAENHAKIAAFLEHEGAKSAYGELQEKGQ